MDHSIYQFTVHRIDGQPLAMADLRGKVLLVVNTASACGFTPQLEGLQQLHQRYAGQGLMVMGFPCNQFGKQDPGSNAEIQGFCQRNYGVDFAMMEKIEVNGPQAAPLYQWLVAQAPGLLGIRSIKWNFTKFLIGRQGQVLHRYAPMTKPAQMVSDIEAALQAAA